MEDFAILSFKKRRWSSESGRISFDREGYDLVKGRKTRVDRKTDRWKSDQRFGNQTERRLHVTGEESSSTAFSLGVSFPMKKAAMEVTESDMFMVRQTVGSVLCCNCGISMQPNAANMCVRCLCSEVDITGGLKKHMIIRHCPECDTYLQPPTTWIKAQLESKELLAFCIKLLHLPKVVRLVNAEFIWTEPHSKRIQLRLRIQKEVLSGTILEQAFFAEFVQQETMCDSCIRVQANPDQWVACVQLRQHVPHRRTFFNLEQLILKHGASVHAINIKQMDYGIDFFFGKRSNGLKFVEFVSKVVSVRSRSDKQLVSHDTHTSNYNYKYTFSVEISPICRQDLVCLPPDIRHRLGNIGPIVICIKVTNVISLLDPSTLELGFLKADQYWRAPFKSLLTSRDLVEYIIFDVVPTKVNTKQYDLADVQVARLSDFGKNNNIFSVKTYLGRILKPGDHALGYDLYSANSNDFELEEFPKAILIEKIYEEKCGGRRKNREYEEFLKDLEVDPNLRFDISLYRNKEYQSSEMAAASDGEDVLSVPDLDELLADLDLSDMETDEDDNMRE